MSRTETQVAGFDGMLQASIDEGMRRVLGSGGAQAIFYHLDMAHLDSATKFHEKLTTIFGVGTGSLERVILQQLHQRMGVLPSSKDEDFVAQVERARRFYDKARLNGRH